MRCNRILPAMLMSLVIGALAIAPAKAQHNPSVDEMIKSLSPTPSGPQTRGIRIAPTSGAAGTATHAPSGTAAQASSAPARPPAVSLNVLFATGSAELTPDAVQTLNDLGSALTNPTLTGYRFRVEGHTDTVGGRDYNKALSDRRAVAVAQYLSDRFHIDPARLQPVGMGQSGLLVPTPDQTPEPRNRRVLVVNIGS